MAKALEEHLISMCIGCRAPTIVNAKLTKWLTAATAKLTEHKASNWWAGMHEDCNRQLNSGIWWLLRFLYSYLHVVTLRDQSQYFKFLGRLCVKSFSFGSTSIGWQHCCHAAITWLSPCFLVDIDMSYHCAALSCHLAINLGFGRLGTDCPMSCWLDTLRLNDACVRLKIMKTLC